MYVEGMECFVLRKLMRALAAYARGFVRHSRQRAGERLVEVAASTGGDPGGDRPPPGGYELLVEFASSTGRDPGGARPPPGGSVGPWGMGPHGGAHGPAGADL